MQAVNIKTHTSKECGRKERRTLEGIHKLIWFGTYKTYEIQGYCIMTEKERKCKKKLRNTQGISIGNRVPSTISKDPSIVPVCFSTILKLQ